MQRDAQMRHVRHEHQYQRSRSRSRGRGRSRSRSRSHSRSRSRRRSRSRSRSPLLVPHRQPSSAWIKFNYGQRAYYQNSDTKAVSLQLPVEGVMQEGWVQEAEAALFETNWVMAGKMDGRPTSGGTQRRRHAAALPVSAECEACRGKHVAHTCERACLGKRKPLARVDNNGAKRRSTLVLCAGKKTSPPPRENSAAPAKDEVLAGLLERVIAQLEKVRGEMDTLKLENARLADRVAALGHERHEEHEEEKENAEEEEEQQQQRQPQQDTLDRYLPDHAARARKLEAAFA